MSESEEHTRDREIDLTSDRRRQQAETLEEIIAFLVHELRNPLAVVKGFAAALEDATERMDEKMMRSSAAAIRRNSEHLSEFVDSIADAYSLTTDRFKLQLSDVLISEIVEQSVNDLEPILNGNPVTVTIADDACLSLDRVRFRQAFTNLLSNAAKYSPPGAPIDVSVMRENGRVRVSITDRGPGIDPERAAELFQKFSRLGADGHGMGMGLFISRGIALAHGGDLYHEPIEDGSRFVLELPATAPSER